MRYRRKNGTHLWRPDALQSTCPDYPSWTPDSSDPLPTGWRSALGDRISFRLAPPNGCWGCDMPMGLHHLQTCQHLQVQDQFKDVVLPAVAFAWHLRRRDLLLALELDVNMPFKSFWLWCMQPLPSDHFLGSISNLHLAFEIAVDVTNLLPKL